MANESSLSSRPLVAGVIAAIVGSVCCVGPLILIMLGIGGAWVSNLTALEPLRPVFIGVTLIFLGLAFRKLYLIPKACAPNAACANPQTLRKQRIVFWAVSVLVLALLTFPWYAGYFFE